MYTWRSRKEERGYRFLELASTVVRGLISAKEKLSAGHRRMAKAIIPKNRATAFRSCNRERISNHATAKPRVIEYQSQCNLRLSLHKRFVCVQPGFCTAEIAVLVISDLYE